MPRTRAIFLLIGLLPALIPSALASALDYSGLYYSKEAGSQTKVAFYVLVVMDLFTRVVALYPCVTNKFTDWLPHYMTWCGEHGCPKEGLSDNVPFKSSSHSDIYIATGVRAMYIAPNHKSSNGQVERFNQTLHSMLSAVMSERPRHVFHLQHLATNLPLMAMAYNTSYMPAVSNTPF